MHFPLTWNPLIGQFAHTYGMQFRRSLIYVL
jgi:hypothetical protein